MTKKKVEEVFKSTGELAGSEVGDLVVKLVSKMTVLEVSDLVQKFEDELGVTPMAPMAVAAAVPAAEQAAAEEEKTAFTVVLQAIGEKKIQVIKEVRALTGLGLKEAKALVDEAPKPVKENVPKEEAETIKAKLEEVGATAEIT